MKQWHYYSEKSVWLPQSFIFSFNVIGKSYRQVLTPVNNPQRLLKLAYIDKFRLVTFHTLATQKKLQHKTGLHWFRRVLVTLIPNVPFWRWAMQSALCFYNDTKLWHFCRLCESISLSHYKQMNNKLLKKLLVSLS